MKNTIYTLVLMLLFSGTLISQTVLQGRMSDAKSGKAILFGTVALYKNEVLVAGTESDLDGNYFFDDLDPGIYDAEGSYVGYTTKRMTGIVVSKDSITNLNLKLDERRILEEVCIVAYKAPLIEVDNTTSGGTVTAERIRTLPIKNVGELSGRVAGVSLSHDGLSIRGSRSNATVYYIDGIRVSGNNNLLSNSDIKRVFPENHQEPNVHDHEIINNEQYGKIVENAPLNPLLAPLSTFSIDVDRASYSNIRRMINDDEMPIADAVRIEEMINYFNYKYPSPSKRGKPFAVHTETATCPYDKEKIMLRVGLQGQSIAKEKLPPSNLVFLIDVSGSMGSENKLPLVIQSFKMLLDELRPNDRVAIVTYAGYAGLALPSTPASDRSTILDALYGLESGGSTAGADGIITAYNIALENFMEQGNNRVILATDGDFNVGLSSTEELEKLIVEKRNKGVFLSVLGYGMGNYKDEKMQVLADKGNGNHAYIDSKKEAEKILIKEFGGTLHTIAKDVKIQIEFNPAYVSSYRLVGYENRMLNTEDFEDDTKDAGEIGSGHSVTALYEIVPNYEQTIEVDENLVYQKKQTTLTFNKELANIKLRYKSPRGNKSKLITKKISSEVKTLENSSPSTRHAIAVAEFGLILRESDYKENASLVSIINRLEGEELFLDEGAEFLDLVKSTLDLTTVK